QNRRGETERSRSIRPGEDSQHKGRRTANSPALAPTAAREVTASGARDRQLAQEPRGTARPKPRRSEQLDLPTPPDPRQPQKVPGRQTPEEIARRLTSRRPSPPGIPSTGLS